MTLIASYPVADATSNSIMWQGCQTFGFLIVLIMDLLRDSNGNPKNNMYRALIMQAALAGLMMLLCFAFRGRMMRTEAIERLKQLEEEEAIRNNEKSDESLQQQPEAGSIQDEELQLDRVNSKPS
jgi:hypothetical protein